MDWYPEYSKALGKPRGPAVKVAGGKTWRREFASGTVAFLDVDKWEHPCIAWADGTFTGASPDCASHLEEQ